MFFVATKNGSLFAIPVGMLKGLSLSAHWFHSRIALKETGSMGRPAGSKGKHSRDTVLTRVRLTEAEKRQVARNAGAAKLPVSAFVRARILPEVRVDEDLADPIPGGRLTARRSALTRALQRVALNLQQIDDVVTDYGDPDLIDDFEDLRRALRAVMSAHLESGHADIERRAALLDQLNEEGRYLNRLVKGIHARGHLAKPERLVGAVASLQGLVNDLQGGEGGAGDDR